ncbi:MAG: hypothetical protein WAO23_03950 [Dethiobacteria bacterium]
MNVSSGDGTAELKPEEIIRNVLDGTGKVSGNLVILFHDSSTKGTTAEALPVIIRELGGRGYEFSLTAGALNVKQR